MTMIDTIQQLQALRTETVLLGRGRSVYQLQLSYNGERVWAALGPGARSWYADMGALLQDGPLELLWEAPETAATVSRAVVGADARIAEYRIVLVASVLIERQRQVEQLGYTREGDAGRHVQLRAAAASYLEIARAQLTHPAAAAAALVAGVPVSWPWAPEQWKPSIHPGRNLVKSFALEIAADDAEQVQQ